MNIINVRGNALFLILIAVALFAALSYAVTQSGRGGGSTDRETASLSASALVQHAALMASTVSRMKLVNGCQDTDFSFNFDSDSDGDYTDAGDSYNNPTSPSDLSCHVYHPNGGGLVVFDPTGPQGLTNGVTSVEIYGSSHISGALPNVFTDISTVDLVLYVRDLSDAACTSINNGVGLNQNNTDAGDLNVVPFVGTYTSEDFVDGCGAANCASRPDDSPWGSRNIANFCFIENDSSENIYAHVLIQR